MEISRHTIAAAMKICTAILVFFATDYVAADTGNLPIYPSQTTALLIIDPYNDFLSEGGKLWPYTKPTAEAVGLVDHMKQTLAAARENGVKVFIVPHRRYQIGDWENAKYLPYKLSLPVIKKMQLFAKDSWGGEFREEFAPTKGDVVVDEHWVASGFAKTNLNEQLKKQGIDHIVLIGMRANTCIESTLREAVELGYHTTVIIDAVAAFNENELKASKDINFPTFAHVLINAEEFAQALSQSKSNINR